MRTRNTIEFLGLWEQLRNPNFNSIEFDAFRNESGSNSFTLTPKKWIEATNSIGIISKSGRYGGTYAHKDIAFEFASWISPTFKLYLITEYQRLKEIETNQYNLEWNVKSTLREFWEKHPDSEQYLKTWYDTAMNSDWKTPNDVKQSYANASILMDSRIVFNIKGNSYQLVIKFNFDHQLAFVRFIGTQSDYDKIDANSI